MLHQNRVWQIGDVEDADALTHKLTEYDWTPCTGFRFGGFLWLNDSTGSDGAQEYAVVREEDMLQVESITFGWCDYEEGLKHIMKMLAGDHLGNDPTWNCYEVPRDCIEPVAEHERCLHCL